MGGQGHLLETSEAAAAGKGDIRTELSVRLLWTLAACLGIAVAAGWLLQSWIWTPVFILAAVAGLEKLWSS